MNTVAIEIPDAINLKLIEAARLRGASAAQLVSEALEEYLERQERIPTTDSFAALASEILDAPGDGAGPTDLSTNKRHMEDYGKW